jgi:hypothetical protein
MQNLKNRIACEKAIIKNLAKICFDLDNSQGTVIYVRPNGDDDSIACTNPTQVYKAVNQCDESFVIVKNIFTAKTLGVFMIVLGNDGFDCIADQSVNDFTAKVDKHLDPIIEKWENKILGL